jgi:hypothetical protein
MKLMNFNHINPNHFGKGLHASSILDKEIFFEFQNNKLTLNNIAKTILDTLI